jgi:hypothetical protein
MMRFYTWLLLLIEKRTINLVRLIVIENWDFYFRAPGSLVVLSFPQLVSFSSVFPKPLSETVTSAGTAGCPTVEHL